MDLSSGCSGFLSSTMRVLIVEDNPSVASLLQRGLEREGYVVDVVTTGRDALRYALENQYGAMVLDLMIPQLDGFTVVRRLRQAGCWTPVLILTARDGVEDRVAGLHAGADDYVTKPFALREVSARLHALSRRASYDRPNVLIVGDITIDPATRRAHRGATEISLTTKEFELLAEFMRHPNEVLSRHYLSEHVFAHQKAGGHDPINFYVARLQEKVDHRFGRRSIVAVTNQGFRIDPRG